MKLIQRVHNRRNLRAAWDEIRHRPESKGIDGITIREFEQNLTKNLTAIKGELVNGSFKFRKLKAVALDKKDGGKRPLKIPSVRDRVVQKAIQRVIQKDLTTTYNLENPASFAYIKKRSTQMAVERVRELYRSGFEWMYQGDISKFFDTVDVDLLLKDKVFPALSDDSLNQLITDGLKAEIGNMHELTEDMLKYFPLSGVGISQGGVLSPLFANVYLSSFDDQILKQNMQLVRYADDFLIMGRSRAELETAHTLAVKILEGELQLKLHPLKNEAGPGVTKFSKLEKVNRFNFLGVLFVKDKIFPSAERCRDMIDALNELPYVNKTLAWNIAFIQNQSLSWGVTYGYTDLDDAMYKDLNEALILAVVRIMENYGFVRVKKGKMKAKELNKLGIPFFDQAVQARQSQLAQTTLKGESPS